MAMELYRPGVRSLSVHKPNPRTRQRYRFAAHKKRLRDPSVRMYEAMLVFAKAIGQYAGTDARPQRVLRVGLNAIFHWWCTEGPRGTGIDKRDDAIHVAEETAEHFGFDEDAIADLMPALLNVWEAQRCRNGRPTRTYATYYDRQLDPVLQTSPLDVPKYRFGAG